jgi:hypothetical protein
MKFSRTWAMPSLLWMARKHLVGMFLVAQDEQTVFASAVESRVNSTRFSDNLAAQNLYG